MTLKPKQIRCKKCANCKESFQPSRSFQSWCSPECAVVIARIKQAKQKAQEAANERVQHAKAKESVKTRAQHLKEAQAAFNAFIRERDRMLPCVSCEKPFDWNGQWHASHFRSVGAAPHLRFNSFNVHKSCSVCNNYLSGNIGSYRPELIRRIGIEKVLWIEGFNSTAKHSIDYAVRIKKIFKKKKRLLEARRNEMLG